MSPCTLCFSFETSSTTSPCRIVELFHLGSRRVADTTYLGRLFNLSAHSPVRDAHRAANHSSLRRPSSRASVASASSRKKRAHSSRSWSEIWPNQLSGLKRSAPVGSSNWTTPSSETFSLTTIFPISALPFVVWSATTEIDTARSGTGRRPTAPFAPWPVSIQKVRHEADEGDGEVAADLISRARTGDGDAFRELTEPYRRELRVHCYRMLGSFQDAEDALQDTLLAAWQGLGGVPGRASFRTWLYRIRT